MLQAKADWYWYFDEQTQTLRLNMSDFVFESACKAKKLKPDAKITRPFSIEDNQVYCDYYHMVIQQLDVSEAMAVQIALNAVAQQCYTLEEQPKSWFFITQKQIKRDLFEQVVLIQSPLETGIFLILETLNDCAKVMLLSQHMQLTETKQLKQFEAIKVMTNRFAPLVPQSSPWHYQNRA